MPSFLNFLPDIQDILIGLPAIILSLMIHELCHGFAAYKLGDSTAKYDGRLSLNPIKHIDPIGFICMILSGFRFGWAKPVMVNPRNLKNTKVDMALIAIAGPASNLIMAFVSMLIWYPLAYKFGLSSIISMVFITLCSTNISLGIFNLLPIPPLDGSKIFAGLLPKNIYNRLPRLSSQTTMLIVMVLVFSGLLGTILTPLIYSVFGGMNWLVRLIYSPFF